MRGWVALNFRELWEFRELLQILLFRMLKTTYKQTALGVAWVVIKPLVPALIISVILGKVANLPSEGAPYLLFAYSGMMLWGVFSTALTKAGGSLVVETALISKVYFPRMVLPIANVLIVLVDFCINLAVFFIIMAVYKTPVSVNLMALPPIVLITMILALGMGFWFSVLSAYYRDFMHALPFLAQIWMYLSPVMYSADLIPGEWRFVYLMNPMVGLLAGFRWSLFGGGAFPWAAAAVSLAWSGLFLYSGALVFKRQERKFLDFI